MNEFDRIMVVVKTHCKKALIHRYERSFSINMRVKITTNRSTLLKSQLQLDKPDATRFYHADMLANSANFCSYELL